MIKTLQILQFAIKNSHFGQKSFHKTVKNLYIKKILKLNVIYNNTELKNAKYDLFP